MSEQSKGSIKELGRKLLQILLLSFLTIFVLSLIIRRTTQIEDVLKSIQCMYLPAIFSAIFSVWILNAIKMQLIAGLIKARINFARSFQIVLAGVFGANITPFYSGGMATQIYFLSKIATTVGRASVISVVYLILSLISSIFFSLVFIVTPHPAVQGVREVFFLSIVLFALFLSSILVLFITHPERFLNFLERILRRSPKKDAILHRVSSMLSDFKQGMRILLSAGKPRLFTLILVSLFSQAIYITLTPLSFYILGINVDFKQAFLAQIALNFTSSLGFSPGGVGVIESAFAGFLYPFAPVKIPLVTLVYRLFSFYLPTVAGGLVFLFLLNSEMQSIPARRNDAL